MWSLCWHTFSIAMPWSMNAKTLITFTIPTEEPFVYAGTINLQLGQYMLIVTAC
jgi:hypothetical protein